MDLEFSGRAITGLSGVGLACLLVIVSATILSASTPDVPDLLSEDAARFTRLLDSPLVERRVEGLQGLSHMRHWPAAESVARGLGDSSPEVRHAALLALARLGGSASVPALIDALRDASWTQRRLAAAALEGITGQQLPGEDAAAWQAWWQAESPAVYADRLVRRVQGAASDDETALPGGSRETALRALVHLATPETQPQLLQLLSTPQGPELSAGERALVCEALERVGTEQAVPLLAQERSDAAAWALGSIGGAEAEAALLQFRPSLPVLLALDRLHSSAAAPLIPHLVSQMGLVTYRGQPDDLMHDHQQPIQRVAANLIRRSGQAPLLVELVMQELEDACDPPRPHGPRPECPPEWETMLRRMRSELKPGFVREDGTTTSQPLKAMSLIADDPQWTARLIPLLRHPAIVPRVYVAFTLARLQASEAVEPIVEIIREGYGFSDATALASGKHFEHSQTVRWRGFLCLALGRMGGEPARLALELLLSETDQPRDIHYGSVVGLRMIGSPDSLPILRQAAQYDPIWMVRDAARDAVVQLQLLADERDMTGAREAP